MILYTILCFIWAMYATVKQLEIYNCNLLTAFIVNFIGFPICLAIAIKDGKL